MKRARAPAAQTRRAARDHCNDEGATLDDLREAVTTLEETAKTTRQVYGGAHPLTVGVEGALRLWRAALRARETPPAGDTSKEE